MTAAAGGVVLPRRLELAALGSTTPIARGGAGSVEAVAPAPVLGSEPLVLKRYHEPGQVDRAVLERLVEWRRELAPAERARLDRLAVWPLALVVEDERLVGFVMRRVPDAYVASVRVPSGARRRVLREAQYLLAAPERMRALHVADPPDAVRLELVRALADAIAFLHQRRVVIGDLSTRNVLWSAELERVLLVDCDAVMLGGVGSPLPLTATVDWDDPAQPDMAAASSDIYKLALFVLRSVSRSFQTRDPAAADGLLDPAGAWLLRMSLASDPGARPTAAAWERWAADRRAAAQRRAADAS